MRYLQISADIYCSWPIFETIKKNFMLKVLKSSSDLGVDPWEGSKMNRSRFGWATIHDRWELQSEQKQYNHYLFMIVQLRAKEHFLWSYQSFFDAIDGIVTVHFCVIEILM